MFDFLKGGQANLTATLDRPNKVYAPGETIHLSLTVQGVKDLKIQKALVTLVTQEEFEYKHEERDSDGDRETVTSKMTDEQKIWEQQFLGETTIKGGSNQNFTFDIPLPPNALATVYGGKILNYRWVIKSTLDRRLAGDVENKQEIYVVGTPIAIMPSPSGEYGISNESGEAQMSLRFANRAFAAGDTISGDLIINPQKQFDASEIRVELERTENVPEDEGNTLKEKVSAKLAGSTRLAPGQNQTLPFQIKIPGGAPITCRTKHGTIDWTLRGVLARRMRGDTMVEQEIIISAPR